MPNQRAKNKVHLGGYYGKELKEDLKKIAKARGVSVSKLVEQLLEDGVKEYRRLHGGK